MAEKMAEDGVSWLRQGQSDQIDDADGGEHGDLANWRGNIQQCRSERVAEGREAAQERWCIAQNGMKER